MDVRFKSKVEALHPRDAYAWIKYFRVSKAGEVARRYIESGEAATPSIVVAEVGRKLLREIEAGNETPESRRRRLEFIRASTQIVDLDFKTAVEAGEIDVEMKRRRRGWSLADSITLTTAKRVDGKVVTGDERFRGMRETLFIRD
ncbi:PIN domain-containing protein [Candidatus Bathyarchaeota archaeon]|nr:PIN domain-containing protein [Candidatus Bathyarchaeota archaeon]